MQLVISSLKNKIPKHIIQVRRHTIKSRVIFWLEWAFTEQTTNSSDKMAFNCEALSSAWCSYSQLALLNFCRRINVLLSYIDLGLLKPYILKELLHLFVRKPAMLANIEHVDRIWMRQRSGNRRIGRASTGGWCNYWSLPSDDSVSISSACILIAHNSGCPTPTLHQCNGHHMFTRALISHHRRHCMF